MTVWKVTVYDGMFTYDLIGESVEEQELFEVGHGLTRLGEFWRGESRLDRSWPGEIWLGKAWRGPAGTTK